MQKQDVLKRMSAQDEMIAPKVDYWRWSVSSMPEALADAGDEWHQLGLSTDAPPTALPFWYASLYEAFGEIEGPVIVHRLYAESRLVAVLPLTFHQGICRIWRPYQYRKHTLLWAFACDNQIDGVGREIRRHLLSSADVVDLKYVLAESEPIRALIEGVDDSRMTLEDNEEEADVYNPLEAPWDQCLTHMASRLARQTRQNRRRLERQGDLVLSVTTAPEDLEAVVTECLDLEKAGWKGRNGTAIRCLPPVECFYRGLAHHASRAGLLALYTLRLKGKLLACNFSLRTGTRIDALKIAYDEGMSQDSPGNVMNYTIMERECQEGRYTSFHWGNPTPVKMRWTDCTNRLVRLLLFAESARGGCSCLALTRLRPLARKCRDKLKRATEDSKKT